MALCRLLLLLVAVAAASSLLAAASPAVLHAAHEPEPPSGELPAAAPRNVVVDDDDALRCGACGLIIIPPDMIRAAAPAGPRGVYNVTVMFRAARRRGQYYYHIIPGGGVPPGSVAGDDDGGHREELFVPVLIAAHLVSGAPIIFLFCLELIINIRGDGDEAYSGDAAVPVKSELADLVHADAVKLPRGDI
ncbi:hypothetical protein SEVIR_1G062250v4 [Setaria viridis]|uniref:Uncharacterized protein n=1 Tax=Setaria viridis TaxID=4556 RepID=A0A4U6W737_SETVI|nr:hypothetical protein SEVIR_1G062250v2 [Setaria viridis]